MNRRGTRWRVKIKDLLETGEVIEIQDGNHGERHPTARDYVDAGIPFVMASDLQDGRVDLESCKFLLPAKAETLRTGFAKTEDVLLTHKGTVGSVAIVPRVDPYIMLTPQVTYYRINNKKLNHRYIAFAFQHPDFQNQLTSLSAQSTRPYIGITAQRQLEVFLVERGAQDKIVAILSAYDDLIENNTRRIRILEEMAQAIYREWFVHFRFPGHKKVKMVSSPLGAIPEGWEARKLGDVCEIVMGQSPKSEFYNEQGEGLPFHQGVTDFGPHFPNDRVYCTVQNRIAEAGDILFSVRAPVGRINVTRKRIVIGRGLCAVRNRQGNQAFTLHQLKERFAEEDTIGDGTIFKAVTKEDTHGIGFLQPSGEIIRSYENRCHPMDKLIESLTQKDVNLRATRDLLLPKLISGEVDVSSLDIEVEGAG